MSLLMQFQIYKQLELIHLTPNEIKIYHMILIALKGLRAAFWYQNYNLSTLTELFGFFVGIIFCD